jgi:hypothetical protein
LNRATYRSFLTLPCIQVKTNIIIHDIGINYFGAPSTRKPSCKLCGIYYLTTFTYQLAPGNHRVNFVGYIIWLHLHISWNANIFTIVYLYIYIYFGYVFTLENFQGWNSWKSKDKYQLSVINHKKEETKGKKIGSTSQEKSLLSPGKNLFVPQGNSGQRVESIKAPPPPIHSMWMTLRRSRRENLLRGHLFDYCSLTSGSHTSVTDIRKSRSKPHHHLFIRGGWPSRDQGENITYGVIHLIIIVH